MTSAVCYCCQCKISLPTQDCTKEPFVGINVTSDEKGNFYLDQKKLIESVKIDVLP